MEAILESSVTRLGLAVWPSDDYTEKPPIGSLGVTMGEKTAIRNPSGYYLFLDTPPGDYRVVVESEYYFDQEVEVTLPLAGEPVAPVTLKLLPSYPFGASATLVRGMVSDSDGKPVDGATARIVGREIENETTGAGEFVLYFKALTESDIIRVNRKRYVRRDGGRKLQLQVTHPNYKKKTILIEVEEGKTTAVSITLRKGGE